jgi:hypothetical protein
MWPVGKKKMEEKFGLEVADFYLPLVTHPSCPYADSLRNVCTMEQ